MNTVEGLASDIQRLATQTALTNQLTESLVENHKQLSKAVIESNERHAEINGRILSIVDNIARHKDEMTSMREDIKGVAKQIVKLETGVLLNKTKISTYWKMIAGAISVGGSMLGTGYLIWGKNILGG